MGLENMLKTGVIPSKTEKQCYRALDFELLGVFSVVLYYLSKSLFYQCLVTKFAFPECSFLIEQIHHLLRNYYVLYAALVVGNKCKKTRAVLEKQNAT